jgi:quinol monooxygenase YgiN
MAVGAQTRGVRRTRRVLAALVFGALGLTGAYTISTRAQQPTQPTGNMLYVAIFVDVTPPNTAAGRKALQQYVADSRKDPGLVRMEAVAQNGRENHFVVFAVWRDQQAFEAHESAAHTKNFRATMGPLMGAPFDQRLHSLLP